MNFRGFLCVPAGDVSLLVESGGGGHGPHVETTSSVDFDLIEHICSLDHQMSLIGREAGVRAWAEGGSLTGGKAGGGVGVWVLGSLYSGGGARGRAHPCILNFNASLVMVTWDSWLDRQTDRQDWKH